MKILPSYLSFNDKRGMFKGIVNSGDWQELNFIETVGGETRGNHYHKKTRELFFIIAGDIEVSIRGASADSAEVYSFRKGDAFIVEPFEIHTFRCKTDAQWINMLSLKIDAKEPDIYQV